MNIKTFITGGTVEKEYNELTGKLSFKKSHLLEMLNQGRARLKIDIRTLMMIDSLDMKEEDRRIILHNCKKAKEDKIIIIHGTDTMVETARLLGKKIKNKTVVLTGAMVPYKFGISDSLFNLGCALAFVQTLQKGVYVAMNGRCFNWNNVRKNKKIGEFEEIKKNS